ncbi:MAG: class I SAM-dependent methyltransferase [Methanolobus sp.]|nr:class I SAM-dependent methyltransferase [Methanolobus sp.]
MKYSDSIDHRLTGRHKKSFRFVNSVRDKVVLDVGCSYGWFENWALSNSCKKITGIEPVEADLESAKGAITNATFAQGSALSIPLENDYFDIVVLWEVLEHLPKNTEEKAFKEIARVLKPGGSFFMSTPKRTFWSCILDPAWWLVGHRHYSEDYLRTQLNKSDLEVVKIESCGGYYEQFSMILLYIFKWLFRSEIPFKEWFDKKRDAEFLDRPGFTNIFVEAKKLPIKNVI